MASKELWHKQPDESPEAYAAFRAYRDLGSERSTAKVARKLGKSKQLMDRWSSRHGWVARAAAFDARVTSKQDEKAVTAAVEQITDEWAQRQIAHRQKEWELANTLVEMAERMIKWPLQQSEIVQEYYADGRVKTMTIFEPARWSVRDISALLALADKLATVATNMPTEAMEFYALLQKKNLPIAEVYADLIREFQNVERK